MEQSPLTLTFIGCGDAFASGGRRNTCFYIAGTQPHFLIDCGATSLIGLKQLHVNLNAIGTILITHFHADHFGGVPFLILDAVFSKRQNPLVIAGPPGLKEKYHQFMDLSFPGSSTTSLRFDVQLMELSQRTLATIGDLRVTPFPVVHGPQVGDCFAYRIEIRDRVLTYSADTQWTDALIEAGKHSDLLICEAYFRERKVPWHLDLATLAQNVSKIQSKRIILTHMSNDVLDHLDSINFECAMDGMSVSL
jgi:ribonuclease BN (tRNA processing enzyme)